MMEIVHTGSPLSTIAEVLVQNIGLRNARLDALPQSKKDWICRLLYTGMIHYLKSTNLNWYNAGFLAVECLDANSEVDQICGLCGIVPEYILGEYQIEVSYFLFFISRLVSFRSLQICVPIPHN